MSISTDYIYSQIKPPAVLERPVKQLYIDELNIPKCWAAILVFAHTDTRFLFLSSCLIFLECQWFSPVRLGNSIPLFQAGFPFLAATAFCILAFSLSYVIGLRWFSETVHHLRLFAQLLLRTVSIWSTVAPSKYSPHISGKAKATSLCTENEWLLPSLYKDVKTYPVLKFGGGNCLILPLINLSPPFECFTYLSKERILPRLETSYKSSKPLIPLHISI